MGKKRITSGERRDRIIETARRLFSEKGFHGATTRELAQEAGVSEALIFKHFPSKEAIYHAMLELCQNSETWSEAYKLLELEPSTSTLAVMLHFIGTKVIDGNDETRELHRLMLRSLSEDGEFARVIFQHVETTWIVKFEACLKAARKAGDLNETAERPASGGWLAQHVMIMLAFIQAPTERVIDYKISKSALLENAVAFCLRGLGVRESAIQRDYHPKAFGVFSAK